MSKDKKHRKTEVSFPDLKGLLQWWWKAPVLRKHPLYFTFDDAIHFCEIKPVLYWWEARPLVVEKREKDGSFVVLGIAKNSDLDKKLLPIPHVISIPEEQLDQDEKILACSEKNPGTTILNIAQGKQLENEIGMVAQLVALGASGVHQSYRQACKAAYIKLAMRPNASPHYLGPTGKTGAYYLYDVKTKAFVRLSDGQMVTSPLFRRSLHSARHRCEEPGESVLVEVSLDYALARASMPCKKCKTKTCACSCSPSLGSTLLLSLSDIKEAKVKMAGIRFDTLVRHAQLDSGGASVCLTTDMKAVKKQIQEKPDRRGEKLLEVISSANKFIYETYGLDISTINEKQLSAACNESIELFCRDDNTGIVFERDMTMTAPQTLTIKPDCPGYDLLAASKFDMSVLAPFCPPCISHVLTECSKDRHPKYKERMIIGSLLCHIQGLVQNEKDFYNAWRSMFRHPEPGCILSKNQDVFDKSKYGLKCIENVKQCFAAGRPFSCPFAIRSGLCPYATSEDPRVECMKKLLEEHPDIPRAIKVYSPSFYFKIVFKSLR